MRAFAASSSSKFRFIVEDAIDEGINLSYARAEKITNFKKIKLGLMECRMQFLLLPRRQQV